ncbi:helix-turn-helix transcriptional regulator [Bacillus haynesii]|uniref:helix-turn-helix domain-containing protein n=1 Tax=Bacillus haynesii TaxID=1925021 RepID=UPI00227DE558|nr:helix-turn-helix transcriptional regulator [Bacillus haynesii]MEC0671933.1 helix-turn-helix transcriptional regulator [Bacillus haynesii]MEC1419234.1 helix-turn-helix transcriptional regulator [Bacillus haynesii]MEC1468788.1 helix-turn-helix transcriptional regulator [Bacillus haynesii]MEC1473988.1 helix-turn-helix transcriptional regulator [Bacillus haynesii]MEC1475159.1 helix-turn-helix transcriptional regulator [Bacillus haynesii]
MVRSRLNEVLKEKGIQSQKELAELVGTTEATISRFKMNTRYDITTLFIISRGLNVPVEDLFYVEEIKEEQ